MADDTRAVDICLIETETVAVQRRVRAHRARVHQLDGLGLENARIAECAALQMREHEFRHVARGGGERARGRDRMNILELAPLELPGLVAIAAREATGQRRRQRLAEG